MVKLCALFRGMTVTEVVTVVPQISINLWYARLPQIHNFVGVVPHLWDVGQQGRKATITVIPKLWNQSSTTDS